VLGTEVALTPIEFRMHPVETVRGVGYRYRPWLMKTNADGNGNGNGGHKGLPHHD
jgi:hypothetical protein